MAEELMTLLSWILCLSSIVQVATCARRTDADGQYIVIDEFKDKQV